MNATYRAGYVAIIGRPNVGKSTLLNQLLGQKIAITSNKPQTTRHTLLGILSTENSQIVFVDTPGLQARTRSSLDRHMNRQAIQSLEFVDAVVHISEVCAWHQEDDKVIELLRDISKPAVHVINKIDLLHNKDRLLGELERINALHPWRAIVPVSASKHQNLDALLAELRTLLPEQDALFNEDEITTASMRFIAAEIVREKLFRHLNQELPYSLGVSIESYQEHDTRVDIRALIYVNRDSHKGIVIGKNGIKLKTIGSQARQDLEKILEKKVVLKTWVKVRKNWNDDEQILKSMGTVDP